MFSQTRFVFNVKCTFDFCVKYVHYDRKFVISKKFFENNQPIIQCNNTTILPDDGWTSKLSAYHELLDVNNDGVVSIEDLRELIERFSKVNDMTKEQSLNFGMIIENLWYKHWGCIDPFDYVTVEKYLSYIQYVRQNEGLKSDVVQLLPYLFKAVDKDHNGHITQDEYNTFLKCIGTSKKNDLIKYLGIINDNDNTIKLENLMFIIRKHLFDYKEETNNN